MFDIIKDLTKSAINIAVTPITVAADVVMFIPDAVNGDEVFNRTEKRLSEAGKNLGNAIDADK